MSCLKANLEEEKRLAAEAGAELVHSGMRVGLGTGSTANHVIQLLGKRVREGLRIQAVPTSLQSRRLAEEEGIPLLTFGETDHLDLTIDGTDEFDPRLHLIKGGGGALLHEKIVASASDAMIVIADSSKKVATLGAFPLPVEVVSFGWPVVRARLEKLGCDTELRRADSGNPFRTQERNLILDCRFGSIPDPERVAEEIQRIPGVVEHGLFVGLADRVLMGDDGKVTRFDHSR